MKKILKVLKILATLAAVAITVFAVIHSFDLNGTWSWFAIGTGVLVCVLLMIRTIRKGRRANDWVGFDQRGLPREGNVVSFDNQGQSTN